MKLKKPLVELILEVSLVEMKAQLLQIFLSLDKKIVKKAPDLLY